jgi:hypothetical protein
MRGAIKRRGELGDYYPVWIMLSLSSAAAPVAADDVVAEKPSDVAVTVYRSPYRGSGSINRGNLGGFALISETRTVHLPAGPSRLRFEGVADGIEPASAIVTGLAQGVIEKNRDGKLLSPSALIAAAVGRPVTLLRTDKNTGRLTRAEGIIRSDAGEGVVFETAEGIEALRCSGQPERFSFESVMDLAPAPTLSVLVRSSAPAVRTVTLSYLARGFDWAADYVATLSADGKSMDLGAWVTLANGNGVSFPDAQTQVVAGRVNRENGAVEPLDEGGPILARCWPRGSTSDSPQYLQMAKSLRLGTARESLGMKGVAQMAPAALQEIAVTGAGNVRQEQLGDLKLYRVPERTTVASLESKQVRLLDRSAIPVSYVYSADLPAEEPAASAPASRKLRTMNTAANHLGLPLPSGRVAVFVTRGGEKLLQHESGLGDLAVDEEVEIDLGESPDVEVTMVKENGAMRASISNARAADIRFELRLQLHEGDGVVHAAPAAGTKNGRPIFRLTIPANETVTLRYQTQHNG